MKRLITSLVILAVFFSVNAGFGLTAVAEEAGGAAPTADPSKTPEEQRDEWEKQLTELEAAIEENQKQIDDYKKQGSTLKSEINSLNAKSNKLALQIKAINVSLAKLSDQITEKQKEINQTENKIDLNKEAISKAVRHIYEARNQHLIEVLLTNKNLSDFFGNLNDTALVQNNLQIALADVTKLRQNLLEQKEELATQKDDAENLKYIQQTEKTKAEQLQGQKNELLKVTKGKESEYQKIVTAQKQTAAQIRSRIFELLGGGELTFEKAYELARIAERATGVRAALILAILHRESLLGKNVGRCDYQTAMHPTRDLPIFNQMLAQWKSAGVLIPEPVKVSCPIAAHGSYGGAMGPAQFIPSTWNLYASQISTITGNTPPSPWKNSDAFAATAVYMSQLLESASCKEYASANSNVAPYQTLLERCAAAKYYSGSRWYTYRFFYGEPVVTKANEFQEDINTLEGK